MTNNAYFHLEYEDIVTVFVLSQSMLPWNAKLLKFFTGPTHSRITSTLYFLVQPGNEERLLLSHDDANIYNTPNQTINVPAQTEEHAEISIHSFTNSHNSRSHCFI